MTGGKQAMVIGLVLGGLLSLGAVTCDVVEYGAKADGKADNTAAIQKATDTGSAKWSSFPHEMPEWEVVVQQIAKPGEKPCRKVHLQGARQPERIESGADGAKRFVCDRLTDGCRSWTIRVVVEEREAKGGRTCTGRIENNEDGIRVVSFRGPFFNRVRTDPRTSALYVPDGLGRRVRTFPKSVAGLKPVPSVIERKEKSNWVKATWYAGGDGRPVLATGCYPGATGMTMPWFALDGEDGGIYAGVHDPEARPKRMLVRYDPQEEKSDLGFEHPMFLAPGETWRMPETVFAAYKGDWHRAAKTYRAWYDTVRQVAVCRPPWAGQFSGWLLVIMKQQNEALFWPYSDLPKLCDVAAANGLDCIGLFGWTKGGHDHLYPDYDPDPKMGGVDALKAGIAEAHRRGIRVYIYANGQLQHVGATKYWEKFGKMNSLVSADGSMVIQNYHKYSDIPKYDFALSCLWAKPWADRMLSLAEQAEGFGADGILYDQLGIFSPFACWGEGHGHAVPGYAYATERPDFIRRIADRIRAKNPNFAILTEGLHDTVLDSVAAFHGCETGTYPGVLGDVLGRATGGKAEIFPELWRYTFPELVTSARIPAPLATRTMVNYAAAFAMRHDIELRYAPDRAWALEGKVPTREGYGTVNDVPNTKWMQENDPKAVAAYLKAVNLFAHRHGKYLLTGRFVDNEGFSVVQEQASAAPVIAKRFVAADGSSAVLVWNIGKAAASVVLAGPGAPVAVEEPEAGTVPADQPFAADSLRLYEFAQ